MQIALPPKKSVNFGEAGNNTVSVGCLKFKKYEVHIADGSLFYS